VKLPEPIFRIVNPLMSVLLRSWLHGVMSSSVLLLSFDGRRTGRRISLPLRYARSGAGFVCFTTDDAKWWRNFEEPLGVEVLVAGETISGVALAERVTVGESLDALRWFLQQFPSDAAYHDVSIAKGANGVPSEADLARTPKRSVRVRISR
jgi:hypothetical protein